MLPFWASLTYYTDNPNVTKWSPISQDGEQLNKVVEILVGISCGEVDDSFPPITHVITLVKMTGSFWPKLNKVGETLLGMSCGEVDDSFPPSTHMISSSGEATTTYCSILVHAWLLSWGDNLRHLCYQYSKSEKLKTVTSQQYINIGKSISIRSVSYTHLTLPTKRIV